MKDFNRSHASKKTGKSMHSRSREAREKKRKALWGGKRRGKRTKNKSQAKAWHLKHRKRFKKPEFLNRRR